MKYYLIHNSDGDTFVTEHTKEELLKELDMEAEEDGSYPEGFLDMLTNNNTAYWGGKCLIIKGEIVTPLKKEVVTQYDLP